MKRTATITALAIAMSGCATSSKDVATAYVSPMQYQTYDCDQLSAEATRLTTRVQQLGGRLDEAASNDKAITGVGAILFWPALFALGGTKQQEAEYGRLKGEAEAVQQAAVMKKCPGAVMAPAAPAGSPASAPAAAQAQATPVPPREPVKGGYNATSTACWQGAAPCEK